MVAVAVRTAECVVIPGLRALELNHDTLAQGALAAGTLVANSRLAAGSTLAAGRLAVGGEPS